MLAEELQRALYPDSMPLLIKRRLRILEPRIQYDSIDFPGLQEFMKTLSPAWATSIIKTWANAWTTSTRMHELNVKECLLGCPGEPDDLKHYIRCSRFHNLLRDDRGRLGIIESFLLMSPNAECAFQLVVAFIAYHNLKKNNSIRLADFSTWRVRTRSAPGELR